jgi:heat shock protein HtpX
MHNAFEARVPGKSVIAVTEPLLNSLNDQELRAVLAHEVGHLRNRDTVLTQVFAAISLATTVLVALLGFAVAFVVALGARRQRDVDAVAMLIGFLVLVGAFLAAAFMALGSRHRELMADEAAIELADGHALISALNKIEAAAGLHGPEPSLALAVAAPRLFVSPFAGSILGAVLASHPSTRRRIRRLQRLLATP